MNIKRERLIWIGLFLTLIIVLLSSNVLSVKVETSNYKIECTPEEALIQYTGYNYQCDYTWKGANNITKDVAYCFNTKVFDGRVIADGLDVTSAFKYKHFNIDKGECYYVQNVLFQPNITRTVIFTFRPYYLFDPKWNTYFGNITTGQIDLELDPLFNQTLYEAGTTRTTSYQWRAYDTILTDIDSYNATITGTAITSTNTQFNYYMTTGWAGTNPQCMANPYTCFVGICAVKVDDSAPTTAYTCGTTPQTTASVSYTEGSYILFNLTRVFPDFNNYTINLAQLNVRSSSGEYVASVRSTMQFCNDTYLNITGVTWNNKDTEITNCNPLAFDNVTFATWVSSGTLRRVTFTSELASWKDNFIIKFFPYPYRDATGRYMNYYEPSEANKTLSMGINLTMTPPAKSRSYLRSKQINLSNYVSSFRINATYTGSAFMNITFDGNLANGVYINLSNTSTIDVPTADNTNNKMIYQIDLLDNATTITNFTLFLDEAQTEVTFDIYEDWTNESMPFNITMVGIQSYNFSSSGGAITRNVSMGAYTSIITNSTGYYGYSFGAQSFTAPTTLTARLYDAYTNITAKNWTGGILTGYNMTLTLINYSGQNIRRDYYNLTNTSQFVGLLKNHNFSAVINKSLYAPDVNYRVPTSSLENWSITVYPGGAINLTIREESNGSIIASGVNSTWTFQILFTKPGLQYTYTTTTGNIITSYIEVGEYIMTVTNVEGNYTTRYYAVSIGNSSSQILNAYTSKTTTAVTFTAFETVDNRPVVLSNATMLLYGFSAGSYVLLESRTTDVSGRAVFNIRSNTAYTLIISKGGYNTVSYSFNPISFTAYNIPLTPTDTYVIDNDTIIYISPYKLWINELNNLTFGIGSPNNLLTYYNYSLTGICTPTLTGNGSFSGGEIIYIGVTPNISCSASDTLIFNYDYNLSTGTNRQFSIPIGLDRKLGNFTIIQNLDETYGMTILERTLIVTVIVLVFAGLGAYFGGDIVGLTLGLFILAYFNIFTQFGTLWANVITIFIGIVLLITRSVNR